MPRAENAGRVAIRYLSGTSPPIPVRDVTFDELRRRVIQTANLLHAQGIGPDDTVTIADAERAGDLLRAVGRRDRARSPIR